MANFYTMTEILNAVYSGTSLTGFSTDAEILNAVFDDTQDALRISVDSSGSTYDDTSISSALSTEIVNRTSGDTSLSTALQSEISTTSAFGDIVGYDVWTGTQLEYNALGSYDPNTLYFITA